VLGQEFVSYHRSSFAIWLPSLRANALDSSEASAATSQRSPGNVPGVPGARPTAGPRIRFVRATA